jgi:hypothetical protein
VSERVLDPIAESSTEPAIVLLDCVPAACSCELEVLIVSDDDVVRLDACSCQHVHGVRVLIEAELR